MLSLRAMGPSAQVSGGGAGGVSMMDPDVTSYTWKSNQTQPSVINLHTGISDPGLVAYENATYGNTSVLSTSDHHLAVAITKLIVLSCIILAAVIGNIIVIISVLKYERLRIIANSFIVSLAFADLLVAVLVMPFSASQEILGLWLFGPTYCDIFNANDVMCCTASLLHLCCISMDRYIAIIDPFHYESRMTKRRVSVMLISAWGASALISHVPIHLGWYTTPEQKEELENSELCEFVVNRIYGAISSCISFWIPTFIMVFVYVKIFREARRQEKQIMKITHIRDPTLENLNNNPQNGGGGGSDAKARNGTYPSSRLAQDRKKLKREHKAAKTLGLIMGAFLCCWLPFFLWYVITNTICNDCYVPDIVVSLLFWVGYMNSALNPIIYAFFNRDFRNAFRKLLHIHRLKACRCRCCCSARRSSHDTACIGEEMQTRPSKADVYDNSTSTPSPRTRKYYDSMDHT